MKHEVLSPFVKTFLSSLLSGQRIMESFGYRALVLVMALGCLVMAPSVGYSEEQTHELPKPFHKTTPPLFQEWNFDQSALSDLPDGFTKAVGGSSGKGEWVVKEDPSAPSRPHLVEQRLQCSEVWCYQLLIAEGAVAEYVDLSVRIKLNLGTPTGRAGLVYGVQDDKNFYAAVVEPRTNEVVVYVVKNGEPTELGRESLIPRSADWHFLRVQRNTLVSKEFTEISFDNHLVMSVADQSFKKGQLGIVAIGDGSFSFDNLRAMELQSNRPLSRPSAY
ncbi:hypothetical protein [uncultured Nitrospira sp.]|uniref:hypothetical protein n=1 Tax=uncultured Nitrospira sp. TaxID=157176 RepID=UPI003140B44E